MYKLTPSLTLKSPCESNYVNVSLYKHEIQLEKPVNNPNQTFPQDKQYPNPE